MNPDLRGLAALAAAAALLSPFHGVGPGATEDVLHLDPAPVSLDATLATVTGDPADASPVPSAPGDGSSTGNVQVTIGRVVFARSDGLPEAVTPAHAYRATFTFFVSRQLPAAFATVSAAGAEVRGCARVRVQAGVNRLDCLITTSRVPSTVDLLVGVDTPAGEGAHAVFRHR